MQNATACFFRVEKVERCDVVKCKEEWLRLYAVTDRKWTNIDKTLEQQVEEGIAGGVTMVQFREKNLSGQAYMEAAKKVQAVCRKYKVPFIINDLVEMAKILDADGVHVGQEDMALAEARKYFGEGKIIGVSAHTVEEAVTAEAEGADYLGVGAVFTTQSKGNVTNMPYTSLQDICSAVSIPVVAIGGINQDNILQLSGSGIVGVAVIQSIFGMQDSKTAAMELRQKVAKLHIG